MQRICWSVHFLWHFHYEFILNSFELRVENRTQIVLKKWGQSQKKAWFYFFLYSKTWNGKKGQFSNVKARWKTLPKGINITKKNPYRYVQKISNLQMVIFDISSFATIEKMASCVVLFCSNDLSFYSITHEKAMCYLAFFNNFPRTLRFSTWP